MGSAIDPSLPPLRPIFPSSSPNSPATTNLINTLNLIPHIEGGYFAETDRSPLRIPNPFTPTAGSDLLVSTRSASTSIHYLLAPSSPQGHFHRNKARTVHTLHKGRARYVIIHADEVASSAAGEGEAWTAHARVETFVVGQDVEAGERLQFVVEGGKYKASFLLPDESGEEGSREGCLISETVVPGFEYADHDFLRRDRFEALVGQEQREELGWLVREVDEREE